MIYKERILMTKKDQQWMSIPSTEENDPQDD